MKDEHRIHDPLPEDHFTSFHDFLHDVQSITENEEEKTLEQLVMKTTEEVGELAQAVLSFTGAPGCKYKGKTREDVDEEAIDVIICAAAVLFRNQPRMNLAIQEVMNLKLRKWRHKIRKEREDGA